MTKISEQQLDDLAKLATDRITRALSSVDQLLEDPEQISLLQHMVIGALVIDAAKHISDHVTLPDGKRPTPEIAFFKVLSTLARCGDIKGLKAFLKEDRG